MDDYELLAEEQVLGDQGCTGHGDGQDDVEQEAQEGDHGFPAPTTMACSGAVSGTGMDRR